MAITAFENTYENYTSQIYGTTSKRRNPKRRKTKRRKTKRRKLK
jgi:hypothetical protein